MYKVLNQKLWSPGRTINKLLLIMRLTTIILITAILQVSASGFAQKISLSEKNASLVTILDRIRTQTGYDFLYESINTTNLRNITINVKDAELKEVLTNILAPQNLKFVLEDRSVLITEKKPSFLDRVRDAFSQITVSGRVVDAKNDPLPGATVRVKGEKRTAKTNADGYFSISNVDDNAILEISYLGFKVKELKAATDLGTIAMEILVDELKELTVVSTGIQTLPKERATGSFKVISQEQLEKPTANLGQRLIGTTAGLTAVSDINGNPTFRVRGLSTLPDGNTVQGNSNPLIVVDGFPIEGDFNSINPNIVESVVILKDAAASSIWGARSANGVIVVTTKAGKKGQAFQADVSVFTRIASIMDIDYVRNQANSSDYVDWDINSFRKFGAQENDGTYESMTFGMLTQGMTLMNEAYIGRITNAERDAGLARLRTQDNRQQIRDYLLANPVTNQYNLNLSGGSDRVSMRGSVLYETNQFDWKGDNNKRGILDYRFKANITKWLDLEMSSMLQYEKAKNNGAGPESLWYFSPYDMLKNEDGSLVKYEGESTNFYTSFYGPTFNAQFPHNRFPYDYYTNPLRELNAKDLSNEQINARIQAAVTAKIIPGLSFTSRIQYENFNRFVRDYYSEDSEMVRFSVNNAVSWDQTPTGAITLNLPKGAILDQNRRKSVGYTFRNQVDFNRMFADNHEVSFVAGVEVRDNVTQTFTNPRTYGYNDETLTVAPFPNGPGGAFRPLMSWRGYNVTFATNNSFSYLTQRYFSAFGNLAYTFKQKYTVSGSIRTDAANTITNDPSLRYSPFWSVGGSWIASRENFLKDVAWLDQLKLRATYGFNGNPASGSPLILINVAANPNVNTGANTANISNYGNPSLRWERTGTVNLGVDFSIFKGKLFGSVEGYNKRGKDIIALLNMAAINGTNVQNLNNAEMYNRGVDIELNTNLSLTNGIKWRPNVNISYNENKITKLFRANYSQGFLTYGTPFIEGVDANMIWASTYTGVRDGVPTYQGPDGIILPLSEVSLVDGRSYSVRAGTTYAPYQFATVQNFDVYDFTLSFTAVGKFGHVFRRTGYNYASMTPGFKYGPNARYAEAAYGDPQQILTIPQEDVADYWNYPGSAQAFSYLVESANHFRLQEISLTYRAKPAFVKKLGISGLRLNAMAQNVFTITNNKYGEDPEFQFGSERPMPRFTLGLNVNL